jgi:hypothetical protein
MRRLPALLVVASLLCGCGRSANFGKSASVLGRKQVENAFRRTGLVMQANLADPLPKAEIADYSFGARDQIPLFGTALLVYTTVGRARRESVAFQHGVSTKRYFTPASRTFRVGNVVLVLGPRHIRAGDVVLTSRHDERVLRAALSRLGKIVSP